MFFKLKEKKNKAFRNKFLGADDRILKNTEEFSRI